MFFVEVTKFIIIVIWSGRKKISNLFPINSAAEGGGRILMFDWASVSGINWPKSSFGWQQELNPDQTFVNKPIFINLITSNLIKDVMMVNKELKINSEIMTNRRLDYFPLQHMAQFLHVCAYLFLKALNNRCLIMNIFLDKSEFVINTVPQIFFLFSVCLK